MSLSGATPAPPVSVRLTDLTLYDNAHGTAVAAYTIVNNGAVTATSRPDDAWLFGGGTPANYEVRATVTSGSLFSGSTGIWLNCGTSRTWTVKNTRQDNSTLSCVMLVEIRLASSGVVQASAYITLEAESDNYF